jgi:hypothetical protein
MVPDEGGALFFFTTDPVVERSSTAGQIPIEQVLRLAALFPRGGEMMIPPVSIRA